MATNSKKYSLFFLLFTLLASLLQPLHARESQFFSKFSNNHPQETQQQPNFIPQTQESTAGYGLYGHLPPSTTTPASTTGGSDDNLPENYSTVAYTTPTHSQDSFVSTDTQYENKNQYNKGDRSMYNNQKQDQFLDNGRYYDKNGENMYNSPKQGMGETSFMYNTEKQGMGDTRVLDDKRYYQGSDMYNSEKQHGMGYTRFRDRLDGSRTDGRNMYNTEKHGMSDTRFMENGKYYYDLNSENEGVNLRGRNGYNRRGYSGNSDNSYDRYNSNARFEENEEDGFSP